MKHRQKRMRELAAKIISACMLRTKFRSHKDKYLVNNEALVIDILNLIDGIKKTIEAKIKIKFKDIEDVAMDPLEDDNDGQIHNLDSSKEDHRLAIALLGTASKNKYNKIAKSIKDYHPIPSFYIITKDKRPQMSEVQFNLSGTATNDFNNNLESIQETDLDTTVTTNNYIRSSATSEEEEETRIILNSSRSDIVKGCKIDGGYSTTINALQDKHKLKGRNIHSSDNIIVLDSFDGAEHLKSKQNITSVISFSSSLNSPSWIQDKVVTGGSSLNILTWQQVLGS